MEITRRFFIGLCGVLGIAKPTEAVPPLAPAVKAPIPRDQIAAIWVENPLDRRTKTVWEKGEFRDPKKRVLGPLGRQGDWNWEGRKAKIRGDQTTIEGTHERREG